MDTPRQSDPAGGELGSTTIQAVLVLIGFTAVIAQIVLLRELIVVFYGNEMSLGLMLANWLLWTAVGSSFLGRIAPHTWDPRWIMAGLETILSVSLPLTILAVRISRRAFPASPGELLGPGPMFLTSLAVLSLFCAVSGWLFAAGSRLYAHQANASAAQATGSVYLLEAVGSGVGGLLASLALIRYLSAFEIAALLSLLNLVAATALSCRKTWLRRTLSGVLLGIFLCLIFPFACRRLEAISLAHLWHGFRLVAVRNSVYGNLAVAETEGNMTVYENGLALFTAPDPATAEEEVHYALLEHPEPKSLLLIGGGVNGSVTQALQHPSLERLDYVELDPAILDLARQYFPTQWAAIATDPRVRVHHTDGRLFLKTINPARLAYDVIIVNLPDPQTAQLNRFYTVEFFREVRARLAPGGVLSIRLTAAEDYISPALAEFLRCVNKTLREVFPEVANIPGETVHFFAAMRSGVLAGSAQELLSRLESRRLHTSYVREYYIPFRMAQDRMQDLELQIRPETGTPVNRDFAPIAYYFDVSLWSTRFNRTYRQWFEAIAHVTFGSLSAATGLLLFAFAAVLRLIPGKERRLRASAAYCVAATGFTLIGLEMLLLLGFQAIYGYVYHQLAIVIAALMVGMALGSWRAVRPTDRPSDSPVQRRDRAALAALQFAAAVSALLLWILFDTFAQVQSRAGLFLVSQILFPALALLCGLLGGYQFPLASRIFFGGSRDTTTPGALYALDLLGACLGALAFSAYLIPVFGFLNTALLTAVVNLAPAVLAALSVSETAVLPER